jgi:hypothetical protein
VITLLGYGVLYASGNRDTDTWMWVALVCALLPLTGMLRSMVLIERRLTALDAG